ncbi:hypothetical protein GQ602_002765 [Ophiocordyceps camponoti-floridani]|uniref:Uncharacterized protein n=1 Tax=Ophiocordyceps camponoti-floridani TaxID=2030778 RepID=A0A8H4VFP9_9HYPO|nr:hypothetical protein GQ602_002765 [Ophiocordyceps camponoti-floridani]
MTVGDFFSFSKAEYKTRVASYTTQRLQEQQILKTRQRISSSFSIGSGVVAAPVSGGATLAVSAYGSRRLHVARKKLRLIEEELVKRGQPLHKLQKRDVLIPVIAGIFGLGLGFGIDELGVAAAHTISLPVEPAVGLLADGCHRHRPARDPEATSEDVVEKSKEKAT